MFGRPYDWELHVSLDWDASSPSGGGGLVVDARDIFNFDDANGVLAAPDAGDTMGLALADDACAEARYQVTGSLDLMRVGPIEVRNVDIR